MTAIAWAIVVSAILASDTAYAWRFGQSYNGAGFMLVAWAFSMLMLIGASFGK